MPKAEAAQASQPFDDTKSDVFGAECRAGRPRADRPSDAACRPRPPRPTARGRTDRRARHARPRRQHRRRAVRQDRRRHAGRRAIAAAPPAPRDRRRASDRAASAGRAAPDRRCASASSAKSSASPVTCQKSAWRPCTARSHEYCSCLSRHNSASRAAASPEHIGAAPRRRGDIEQRAVGVEDAGADAAAVGPRRSVGRGGALFRLRPARGDARQHFLDQPPRLRQHLASPRAAGRRMNFETPAVDIRGDALDDRRRRRRSRNARCGSRPVRAR